MEDNPEALEASPWEFWDPAFWSAAPFGQANLDGPDQACEGVPIEFCNWHLISLRSNPDMSAAKAVAYQDTILAYFAPRAFEVLDLDVDVSTEDVLNNDFVSITPNPVRSVATVTTGDMIIKEASLFNVSGQLMRTYSNVNNNVLKINRIDNERGMYVLQVRYDEGITTHKIMFE